jgi:hypothetical protein
MNRFALTTKNGEVINTMAAKNLEEAIEIFSSLKKITVESLLEIYEVKVFVR